MKAQSTGSRKSMIVLLTSGVFCKFGLCRVGWAGCRVRIPIEAALQTSVVGLESGETWYQQLINWNGKPISFKRQLAGAPMRGESSSKSGLVLPENADQKGASVALTTHSTYTPRGSANRVTPLGVRLLDQSARTATATDSKR